jgi:OmpA-OmpF porin, OOP family
MKPSSRRRGSSRWSALLSRARSAFTAGGLGLVAVILTNTSCSQVPVMRGEIEGLSKVAEQAERNGALRCAPRELAMAKSHLTFATVELDQGFLFRAKEHLDLAQANAHAAYDLSPPQKCAERGFVEDAPPPKPGDKDGDGYLDPDDKCPEQPENYQAPTIPTPTATASPTRRTAAC